MKIAFLPAQLNYQAVKLLKLKINEYKIKLLKFLQNVKAFHHNLCDIHLA